LKDIGEAMPRKQLVENEILYRRTLPGGGFVIIRLRKVSPLLGRVRYRGELVVERRTDISRRQGHVAPVVTQCEASTKQAVLQELFPVAHSNTALAVACMARRPSRAVAPGHAPAIV
jgi:hypothetical protein